MRFEEATVEYTIRNISEGNESGQVIFDGSMGNLYNGPVAIREGEAHLERVGLVVDIRCVDAVVVDGKPIDFRSKTD